MILAAGVIIGCVIALGALTAKDKGAETGPDRSDSTPRDTGVENPFADLPDVPIGRPGSRSKSLLVDTAPPGLKETPLFKAAKTIADKGRALAKEAKDARAAGNEELFRTKGLEARENLELAFSKVGDWMIELGDKYPNDRQVDRLSKELESWDKSLRIVRKIR